MRSATLLAVSAAVVACGGPPPGTDTAERTGAAEIPQEVQVEVARVGEDAAQALRAGLSQRLTAAIAEGGPESAIEVCALEALPLTDSIAAASSHELVLKRTSLRIRNPRNAPDALEREALEWFAAHDADEARPPSLVQRDGDGYRYYSPLRTAAMCAHCHGPAESLSQPVRAALRSRYPDDEATGYAEGELRGLIRVSVPASVVRRD